MPRASQFLDWVTLKGSYNPLIIELLDVSAIRGDFPILEKGVVYFDNAASSLTPEQVLAKEIEFYHEYRANVERGVHRWSQRASEEYEYAHDEIARFIGAPGRANIALTGNTTQGINLVANSMEWDRGESIVTTVIEHHSNFITWLRTAEKNGCEVRVVRSDQDGVFQISDFEEAIDDSSRLVAVTHVSNVLGCILPVKKIVEVAHEHGAKVLVDAAQGVPHMPVDVIDLGVDYLAFSGHKMLGPTGTGGLYISEEELKETEPLCIGGGTIADVSIDSFELAPPPMKFEAGTPNIAGIIGLGEACRYLNEVGMKNIRDWDERLAEELATGLQAIDGVEIYGPRDPSNRVGLVSFNIRGVNPHDVALTLDSEHDIAVRSGHHCALPLMKELFQISGGSVRASTYLYNTREEVERFLEAVEGIAKQL
ncbi:MAG: aminotransferase class V-fold PLP-dependent enzyme [Candidatus Bathyarchaeia archaeon]